MPVLLTIREAAWYIISVVSVCLSFCQTITFENLEVGSFAYPEYLHGIRVSFVYEGHWVKVKVIGPKTSKIPISVM